MQLADECYDNVPDIQSPIDRVNTGGQKIHRLIFKSTGRLMGVKFRLSFIALLM